MVLEFDSRDMNYADTLMVVGAAHMAASGVDMDGVSEWIMSEWVKVEELLKALPPELVMNKADQIGVAANLSDYLENTTGIRIDFGD